MTIKEMNELFVTEYPKMLKSHNDDNLKLRKAYEKAVKDKASSEVFEVLKLRAEAVDIMHQCEINNLSALAGLIKKKEAINAK